MDIDDRWPAEGLCALIPAAAADVKRIAVSGHVKMAMSTKLYNVRGTGVRNAFHLSVGMAAASSAGGKEVKRAAISQEISNDPRGLNKKKVGFNSAVRKHLRKAH